MQKMISEKDYERYKIFVPLKTFVYGRQKKYISSELEKLHPCFSDDYCFDSKFKVSKKGLYANVVVMEKLRLGEYKAEYPRADLTCQEKDQGKIFVEKKTKIFITILLAVTLFLFAVMLWQK